MYYNHPKDIDVQSLTDEDVIIFLDDIIGSGDSFATDCKLTFEKEKNGKCRNKHRPLWGISNIIRKPENKKVPE